jgi:hypothetical protein
MTDVTATPPAAPAAPAPPAAPSTPQEAASKLASLRADSAWGDRVLKSEPGALKEFHELSRLASQADAVDLVMSGEAEKLPNLGLNGQPSLAATAREIPALREAGLSDGVIRELLSGRESTAEELSAVRKFQTMRHSDKSWVDRYLKGDFDAVREARLIAAVLSGAPP